MPVQPVSQVLGPSGAGCGAIGRANGLCSQPDRGDVVPKHPLQRLEFAALGCSDHEELNRKGFHYRLCERCLPVFGGPTSKTR